MALSVDQVTSLLIVDVQYDFCPGGALAIKDGDKVIEAINQYIPHFQGIAAPIFAARDWHPKNHISFKERGGPFPAHCIQGSKGADFHSGLKFPYGMQVISKGFLTEQDAETAFQGTDLESRLKEKGIKKIFVSGLGAAVKSSALEAVKLGFETYLLTDAVKGIEIKKAELKKVFDELTAAGICIITLKDLAPPVKIRRQFISKTRGKDS